MSVDEHTIELGPTPAFFRSAPASQPPPLYLHGVPTSSDQWSGFLDQMGGIAPDLLGFGRSGKGVELDYSISGLADFVEDLLDALEVGVVNPIAQGWGAAVALELAQRRPERVERLVLFNPLPLVAGFEWPRIARVWRLRIIGELAMGFTTRGLLTRGLRRGSTAPSAWPADRVKTLWEQFDQGTQRATLRLHRSVDGPQVGRVEAPALIVWGEEDPWFPATLADSYRAILPRAQLERVAGAGHWPWLDRPELIARVASFLEQ